jgi:hypothetical protein
MKRWMKLTLLLDKNESISEKQDVLDKQALIFILLEDQANGISISVFTHKDT